MRPPDSAPPPRAVLACFGVSSTPVPLPGGQRTAWRAGPLVFKPLDVDPWMLPWQAELLGSLDGHPGFRVAPPVSALDGEWIVAGWTAWRWGAGRHEPGRWPEIVDAGRRFHAALADVAPPRRLSERRDEWAVADRMVWDELPLAPYAGAAHVSELAAARRPVTGRCQLVHGDLTGNVLIDGERSPLIIDLAPYWRPPQFAAAVVVADALVFGDAPAGVVEVLAPDADRFQYLLRALLFRVLAGHLRGRHPGRREGPDPYRRAVELVLRGCRRD